MRTLKLLFQLLNEDVNFLLTNRIPRRALTLWMGWFSKIEHPLLCRISIAIWRCFADLDLSESRVQTFSSLHACFVRELKPSARPIHSDRSVLVSPCDAIVGAQGLVDGTRLYQAKGFPYTLEDLLPTPELVSICRDSTYVTLRIKSSMYHRFHAPSDLHVERTVYVSGDTWNVNPIALKRVERLFCRNERAVVQTRLPDGAPLVMVPVAAILVASIRLHFLDTLLHLRYQGPNQIECNTTYKRGEEMGWFEHGSTIIVFAPKGYAVCAENQPGAALRMGQPLMRRVE